MRYQHAMQVNLLVLPESGHRFFKHLRAETWVNLNILTLIANFSI